MIDYLEIEQDVVAKVLERMSDGLEVLYGPKGARIIKKHYTKHNCVPAGWNEVRKYWTLFKSFDEIRDIFDVSTFRELKNHEAVGGVYDLSKKWLLVFHDGTRVDFLNMALQHLKKIF